MDYKKNSFVITDVLDSHLGFILLAGMIATILISAALLHIMWTVVAVLCLAAFSFFLMNIDFQAIFTLNNNAWDHLTKSFQKIFDSIDLTTSTFDLKRQLLTKSLEILLCNDICKDNPTQDDIDKLENLVNEYLTIGEDYFDNSLIKVVNDDLSKYKDSLSKKLLAQKYPG